MLASLVLASGCAARMPADTGAAAITPEDLLSARPLTGDGDLPQLPDADVLGLDAGMRDFVARHVDTSLSPERRLVQLLAAVIGDARFGVVYNHRTYTAAEAFHLREANCLSFTNMFIALAREARIPVRYQEVDVPPDWSVSGDMLVLSRHINVLVASRNAGDRVVDFNMADFHSAYDRRVIADTRARAHYYSNLGAERLQALQPLVAAAYFRKAIIEDAAFAPAWVNLGAVYLREGHPDWAQAAWWQALAVSPGEPAAISNLERVYRQEGRVELADDLRRRIQRHRAQNPYYRYYLAQQAFDAGQYAAAIGHLRFAVRANKSEDRFMALLGLSYLRQGDLRSARRWLAEAEAVADDTQQREHYHGKLELLQKINAG